MLVLGTHNKKKGQELRDLLDPHGIALKTLVDFPNAIDVVEDGNSFAANAALKATQQARHVGEWVIAEDSGLSVDALKGRPGIYSARYAGEDATDLDNNQRLLEELVGVPLERRTAHYVCHISLSDPDGQIHVDCEDVCHGRIRLEPAGSAGFGYDPLFEVIEYHQTFGQLGAVVKSLLSHRGRAMRHFLPRLLHVIETAKL
jgi:XTP/dITP diphosphohydrolase